MTRKGAKQQNWTFAEISYLKNAAGDVPFSEICKHLKRTRMSVKMKAHKLGLSLRTYQSDLVWCTECATWRTELNRDGRCPVCQKRAGLIAEEGRCAEEMANMSDEQRSVYEHSEARRGRRSPYPPHPIKHTSSTMTKAQSARAEDQYLREIEAWELNRIKLDYDAAKTRLRRMREVLGTNPRKNKKRETL